MRETSRADTLSVRQVSSGAFDCLIGGPGCT